MIRNIARAEKCQKNRFLRKRDGHTNQRRYKPTDGPSYNDAFLTDASKNRKRMRKGNKGRKGLRKERKKRREKMKREEKKEKIKIKKARKKIVAKAVDGQRYPYPA